MECTRGDTGLSRSLGLLSTSWGTQRKTSVKFIELSIED